MKKTIKTLIIIAILIISFIVLSLTDTGNENSNRGAIHPKTAPKTHK
jgi:hypothetical protein